MVKRINKRMLWSIIGVVVLILIVVVVFMLGGFGEQTGFLSNNLPSPSVTEINDPLPRS